MRNVLKKTHLLRRSLQRLVDLVHNVEDSVIPDKFKRTYRFVLSGVPSQVVYYSLYVMLPMIGLHYLVASLMAFVCYIAVNFALMRRWVFGSDGHPLRERFGHFLLHASNQIVSMSGLYVLVSTWGWNYVLAQLPMSLVYFGINLVLSKFIFDPKDSE